MRSGKNRKNLFEISVDYVCAIFGIEGSVFIQINKLPSILYTRKIAIKAIFLAYMQKNNYLCTRIWQNVQNAQCYTKLNNINK
jgi:hypothetical protein